MNYKFKYWYDIMQGGLTDNDDKWEYVRYYKIDFQHEGSVLGGLPIKGEEDKDLTDFKVWFCYKDVDTEGDDAEN